MAFNHTDPYAASTPSGNTPSVDGLYTRNSTRIIMQVFPPEGGQYNIGRIQSMREDITNNVQVLDELGAAYAVELKKGISHFTFSIARFLTRSDIFAGLMAGQIFGISVFDLIAPEGDKTIEYFKRCAITSVSMDYSVGQAVVGLNATVVTVGAGLAFPS